MNNETGSLDALIQEKIDSDTEFTSSLEQMSDEDKETALATKKTEIIEQEITSLREKAEKATKSEEVANNYKTRAEKAEKELKEHKASIDAGTPSGVDKKTELSQKDVITLAKADIHEDDIEEVIDYAKHKGISVAEALKTDVMKITLSQKDEFRKSAEAANVKKARPGSKTPTGDELLRNLSKGEVPEAGSKEAEDLFWARRGGKR